MQVPKEFQRAALRQVDNFISWLGLEPIVFVCARPKNKGELLTVLNVDSNLTCAINFFDYQDTPSEEYAKYKDCVLLLGLRKKKADT